MTSEFLFVFLLAKQTKSKPVKQEVNSIVMLPPLVFPGVTFFYLVTDLPEK
jgi:hypothetical protein